MDARDPAKGDDEGAALTVISGLAKEATSLFQNGLYSECVDVLGQILQKKQDDPKVLHNIAIAEFYKSGCSEHKSLLAALKSIKKKIEELTHVSTEDSDNSTIPHQMASDSANSSYSCDHDTSIITLNTAIIHYYLHDYAHAASLLKPVYTKLQPLDEMTAIHVCILLIDVALASNNASDAAEVIQFMEKSFNDRRYTSNQGDNGNTLQFQPSVTDNTPSDSRVTETHLDRMLSEDTIEYETLISTLDNSSGQGLNRSTTKDSSLFPPIPSTDLKLKIHLYKVKLLLLTRNFKTAKREIKLGMNGRDSSVALVLKAHLEYSRGNYRKAVKLLSNLSANADRVLNIVLNNNLGCVLHRQRSYETSLSILHKALGESNSLLKQRREKTPKFTSLSPDKSPYISYNCGIQLLMNTKFSTASTCFYATVRSLGDKPLLWLRLAECCIGPEGSRRFYHWTGPLTIHVIGSGKWRRLVIKTGTREGQERETRHTLSLPFARECLQNALLLLDEMATKSAVTITGKVNTDNGQQDSEKSLVDSSVAAYEGMVRRENGLMKQAALADLAYVELTLNNPVRALTAARELQSLPGCSRIYSFFSRVYASEALLLLDRVKEAIDQISVFVSDGNDVDFPYLEEDGLNSMGADSDDSASNGPNSIKHQVAPTESEFAFLVKPKDAQQALMVNLGMLSAVEGDLGQARVFLGKVLLANPSHPHALVVAAYVDLREGATSAAASKLKRCSHVRFL